MKLEKFSALAFMPNSANRRFMPAARAAARAADAFLQRRSLRLQMLSTARIAASTSGWRTKVPAKNVTPTSGTISSP